MVVACAAGTRENAAAIAAALVEGRIAACVQIFPIESVYRWDGAVRHEPELMLHAKTTRARFPDAAALIGRLHAYDLPEIVALPIVDASPDYLRWIEEAVRADGA